jgi:hypothetical protein
VGRCVILPQRSWSGLIKNYAEVYASALQDPEAFWAERAGELEWFRKWERVLDDGSKPFYRWFVGGRINICYNAVDRHMKTWRKNKVALYWESERGITRILQWDISPESFFTQRYAIASLCGKIAAHQNLPSWSEALCLW